MELGTTYIRKLCIGWSSVHREAHCLLNLSKRGASRALHAACVERASDPSVPLPGSVPSDSMIAMAPLSLLERGFMQVLYICLQAIHLFGVVCTSLPLSFPTISPPSANAQATAKAAAISIISSRCPLDTNYGPKDPSLAKDPPRSHASSMLHARCSTPAPPAWHKATSDCLITQLGARRRIYDTIAN